MISCRLPLCGFHPLVNNAFGALALMPLWTSSGDNRTMKSCNLSFTFTGNTYRLINILLLNSISYNQLILVVLLKVIYICNGCTDLQLGRSLKKTLFYLNICHLETTHHTAFHSFCLFDFINKIEKNHSIHIKGR